MTKARFNDELSATFGSRVGTNQTGRTLDLGLMKDPNPLLFLPVTESGMLIRIKKVSAFFRDELVHGCLRFRTCKDVNGEILALQTPTVAE